MRGGTLLAFGAALADVAFDFAAGVLAWKRSARKAAALEGSVAAERIVMEALGHMKRAGLSEEECAGAEDAEEGVGVSKGRQTCRGRPPPTAAIGNAGAPLAFPAAEDSGVVAGRP